MGMIFLSSRVGCLTLYSTLSSLLLSNDGDRYGVFLMISIFFTPSIVFLGVFNSLTLSTWLEG